MRVRASTVDGIFYPADREALAERVEGLLAGGGPAGTAGCLISPHAAYEYSGGAGRRGLPGGRRGPRCERVLLLGPVHREPATGCCCPSPRPTRPRWAPLPWTGRPSGAWPRGTPASPWTTSPTWRSTAWRCSCPSCRPCSRRRSWCPCSWAAPRRGWWRPWPGRCEQELALAPERTLIVVSANLTCYRPREQGQREAQALLEMIRGGRLARHPARRRPAGKASALVAPAVLLLYWPSSTELGSPGRDPEAGQLPGRERRRAQGRPLRGDRLRKNKPWNKFLTSEERGALLKAAREAIEAGLAGRPGPRAARGARRRWPSASGAFVTLTRDGRLRGCIGFVIAERPLLETVREAARAAAFHDPRFPPLRRAELSGDPPGDLRAERAPARDEPGGDPGGQARPDRAPGPALRPAPAAGGHGVRLGPGNLPLPHLRQGRACPRTAGASPARRSRSSGPRSSAKEGA